MIGHGRLISDMGTGRNLVKVIPKFTPMESSVKKNIYRVRYDLNVDGIWLQYRMQRQSLPEICREEVEHYVSVGTMRVPLEQ